ncbi:unnamed protein product [Dovyalis caffra]|uniref:Probable magnesium transporter n=1 Tax=Dovyalis caffra TaxID=77055 RepID=A0AAV1SMR9_9ROSI|nr:unnamed protein product [Dovyalis caffra]
MWESICLTLAATAGNNIGKVLQKKGTVILPPLSFKLKVIRAYVANKAWIIGFLMDICGALLMLRALSQAPVSIIQPVSGCGLAILCVFSHFYLKEVMNVIDWMGITLAGIGTIGVGAGGEEQEASPISIFQLPWLALLVAILFVASRLPLYASMADSREQLIVGSWLIDFVELVSILSMSNSFGRKSCISCKNVAYGNELSLSKTEVTRNVSFAENHYGSPSAEIFIKALSGNIAKFQLRLVLNGWLRMYRRQRRAHETMDYEVVEEIIYGLESGILFGYDPWQNVFVWAFTRGLKHGRAIVVSTCAAVASIVTGVLAGMLALGEQLPSAPAARFSLLLGWLLIVVGVILLVSSTWLLRHLPPPLRRFIRGSADRNFSLSRSGSLRLKDPNPTAVIHAATLHQLISSPSKEKA